MRRNKPKFAAIASALAMLFFVACNKSTTIINNPSTPGPSENGAGYGGGDPLQLKVARRSVVLSLTLLMQGFRKNKLGNFAGCTKANDPAICNLVSNATIPQKDFAKQFILGTAKRITELNRAASPIPFKLTGDEIFVLGPNGDQRSVSARTELSESGPIELFTPSVFGLSPLSLMALLMHEFLHKVIWSVINANVNDNLAYGNGLFISTDGGGRQLNDTAGAMLALLWADEMYNAVPVIAPDSEFACYPDDMDYLFGAAPYFYTPTAAQFTADPNYGGQQDDDIKATITTIGSGDFTVTAWARRDSDALDEVNGVSLCANCVRIILSNDDSTSPGIKALSLVMLQNGNFGAYVGTDRFIDSGIALTPNRYHQVAVRKTGNVIETFVDGVKGYSDSALFEGAKGNIDNGNPLYVGRPYKFSSNATWKAYWKGNITQALFYTRAITDTELGALFTCGRKDGTTDVTAPPTAPTKWIWKSGLSYGSSRGVYGTINVASASNLPGTRYGAVSGKDASGKLLLFGGNGYDKDNNSGKLNDLWKFDGTNWTWLGGSQTVDTTGVYNATAGVSEPAANPPDHPGGREDSVSWTDASGNFWLFGGQGFDSAGTSSYLNDLWKFDGTTWTWMTGAKVTEAAGTYGTQNTPDPANAPGARYGAAVWTDPAGILWLFGGYGADSAGSEDYLNDLWKYDITSGQWTWVSGSKTIDQLGNYGTLGAAAGTNVPGARRYASAWRDASGKLWLFGGEGFDSDVAQISGDLDDLWKFDPGTGNWTWMAGNKIRNQAGSYGTKGVATATTRPGSRHGAMSWIDTHGKLWLFGGTGYSRDTNNAFHGDLSDLWMFDGAKWTWVQGPDISEQPGNYFSPAADSPTGMPGARGRGVTWVDAAGKLILFGGDGHGAEFSSSSLNDLWSYTPP